MILAAAVLFLAPTAGWADLAPYSQDFEGLDQAYADALADDGWLVYGNVFGPYPEWWWWYGYGPYPAPNGGPYPAFCAIDVGQGGPEQGEQQLVVFSDYNNGSHGAPAWIESNVFQELTIGAADVGTTWRFEFDAKRGNIELDSMASAFIKTLDPAAGWVTTNFLQEPMTDIPDTWGTYNIDIYIDPSLEGQVLQFGFVNWATWWRGSGIFYDNINFDFAPLGVSLDLRPEGCPNPLNTVSQGLFTAAVLGTAAFDVSTIDVATLQLEGVAPVHAGDEDIGTPYAGELCGCNVAGPDGFTDLTLKFDTQEFLDAIGPLTRGYHVLTLTGALLDGTEIEGQDCTVVVGGGGSTDVRRLDRATRSRRMQSDDEAPGGAQDLQLR
jgi:hypothetical protein